MNKPLYKLFFFFNRIARNPTPFVTNQSLDQRISTYGRLLLLKCVHLMSPSFSKFDVYCILKSILYSHTYSWTSIPFFDLTKQCFTSGKSPAVHNLYSTLNRVCFLIDFIFCLAAGFAFFSSRVCRVQNEWH